MMLAHLLVTGRLRTLVAVLGYNLLVQSLECLFSLNILVELNKFLPDTSDHFDLLEQNFIKFDRIINDIRVLLIYHI